MKVLSLKEPMSTLIKLRVKKIETRSWKTNYRGELYIHTSLTKIPKEWQTNSELMSLMKDKPYSYGEIICKCNLIDCIYMTKEYVGNIKNNNHIEYICGVYEEGRYAWILDNVEAISSIHAKGKLGIWNYNGGSNE